MMPGEDVYQPVDVPQATIRRTKNTFTNGHKPKKRNVSTITRYTPLSHNQNAVQSLTVEAGSRSRNMFICPT